MGERGAGAADANAVQLGLRCVKGMGKRGAGASDANAVQLGLRCVKEIIGAPRCELDAAAAAACENEWANEAQATRVRWRAQR